MTTSAPSSEKVGTPEGFLEEGDILIQLREDLVTDNFGRILEELRTPQHQNYWNIPRVTGLAQWLLKLSAGHLVFSWFQLVLWDHRCPKETHRRPSHTIHFWKITSHTRIVASAARSSGTIPLPLMPCSKLMVQPRLQLEPLSSCSLKPPA